MLLYLSFSKPIPSYKTPPLILLLIHTSPFTQFHCALMETHGSSFYSLRSYLRALSHTPSRLARRAFSVSTSYEELSRVRAQSGSNMMKTLRWFDLVGFGIGGMVGAGVFVTSGNASRLYAGPAVIISYAIAGLCALLSAFCYTEFAVDMPVAGGAFSYLRVTFGVFYHNPLRLLSFYFTMQHV